MNHTMTGLSRILKRLQKIYFSLVASTSEFLYMCRQAIVRLSSTVLSRVLPVVNIWKDAHSTSTRTFSAVQQTVTSSTTLKIILNLISLFGSLVQMTIQTGFTLVLFTVEIIARGVFALAGMITDRLITK